MIIKYLIFYIILFLIVFAFSFYSGRKWEKMNQEEQKTRKPVRMINKW